uniref:Uncharacterized protein n=1 Tax=Latimeria chalumnae TaxID=7897 RepID=H3BAV2_LATCH
MVLLTDECFPVLAEALSTEGESGYVTAALGNTWSHSVNTRLIVQYLDSHRRQIIVAKSPLAPFSAFTYTIQSSGLVLQGKSTVRYFSSPYCLLLPKIFFLSSAQS